MKKLLIAASVLTCLFSSAAFAAQAPQTSQPQPQQALSSTPTTPSTPSTQQTSTLTRAQVEHQLAVAQQDGELRYLNTEIYQGS
jgi:opacity protein-like surface antigen